ncbi:hypothetical protein PPERSA_03441 [Pseudocohnilembus persalinus]|uniref:Schlafen AlbA-2 domain-containing protein n=1 Tax=Pseudocohnilembus persalinus TaxID=266149 RepID=A0A0V0QBQ4_PSEPJ|nr:hypothetical protein PPERSA_03441 [Pseudocohnilembus persalinus]|eukprot:KRW99640.1 hypothetical protein PPERSA_03441 [Pseudocohnilembus persalinus]
MEEQQDQDLEIYQQIIEEIQEQDYQNLEILLSLVIKYGIPMFLQMYNFQIFEQIFSDDLEEQELVTKQELFQNNYPQQNQNGNHIIESDDSYNEQDNKLDNDEDNDDCDNYQDNNYDADDDFGLTQSTIFQNYKSKVLDNDSKTKSRVINVVELEKMKQQEKEQNQQKFQEDQYQNEDDTDEDEQYKFLMQSQILSRRKRPEEERKLLEEVDRYQEPLGKQISEPYTQSQIEQKSKKDCCRSYFIQGEKLNKKDQSIEYKNYSYTDLNNNIYKQLKQIVCGMLNSNGGTILIGVEENSNRVVGLNLSINEQDDYKLQILNCVVINQFNPQIGISDNQIRIKFIPVKTKQNKWINGQWIVKIQINPNLSYQMYTLQYDQQDKFQSYIRINGQTKLVKGIELKQYLYNKCKQYYDNNSSETHKCLGEPDKQGVRKCTYYKAKTNNNKIYQYSNKLNDNNPLIKKKDNRNQNSKINYKAQNERSNFFNNNQGQQLQKQREEKMIYKNIQEAGNTRILIWLGILQLEIRKRRDKNYIQ